MAPVILNQWTGSQTLTPVHTSGGLNLLPPVNRSQQTVVSSTDGNWLFAIICVRQQFAGAAVTLSVADTHSNWWEPVGAPSVTSSAAGVTRVSVWCAPAARAVTGVLVAPTGYAAAIAVSIVEVAGLPDPWLSPTAVTNAFVLSGTVLPVMSITPSAQAVVFTACASDNDTATVTQGTAGWTALTEVTATNGTDHTQDLVLTPHWQVLSAATTSAYTSSIAQDMSGVCAGIVIAPAAPAQPAPFWPVTIAETAPAAGSATPPDATTWVPIANPARFLSLTMQQGKQYELDQLQAGTGSMLLDDPDGALIPPGSGAYAGIGSGTPARVRMAWRGGAYQVSFAGDGVTANPGITTGNIFAVEPGAAYTASVYAGFTQASGGAPTAYAAGITVALEWRTAGGALISTVTSSAFTSAAPGLVLASGTAPGTAALASVLIEAGGTPSTAVTFNLAAAPPFPNYLSAPPGITWTAVNAATVTTISPWEFDRRGPPVVTPWGVPFSGFFERLPPTWDPETYRGRTQATIVDSWNYITGNLQPILPNEVLLDNPYAYWPMTDAAGATAAANQAPGNVNVLTVTSSKYGNGGAAEAFGGNSSAILGAQGTYLLTSSVRSQSQAGMWGVTLPSTVTTTPIPGEGFTATCTDPNFPSVTAGASLEFWFQAASPFNKAGTIASVVALGAPSISKKPLFFVGINNASSPAHLELYHGTTAAANIGGTAITDYQAMTAPAHVVITFNVTTWAAWVNGVNTTSGSWSSALPSQFTEIFVNGDLGAYATISGGNLADTLNCMGGFTGHVAVYPTILASERILTHYQAGAFGMAGDASAYRVERLLGAGGYGGRRCIVQEANQFITPVASCQDISGQPATTSVNNITQSTVPAFTFVASTGDVVYLCREIMWGGSVSAVLGENRQDGEIPYTEAEFDNDPTKVINSVQVTQLDNQDIMVPDFDEAASQARYGVISWWVTGYLQGDVTEPATFGPGCQDLANYVASSYSVAGLRVDSVTVNAAALPLAWLFLLTIQPGRAVTVNRRPPTATGELVTFTGRVTQVTRHLNWATGTATVELRLDVNPAGFPLTLDNTAGLGLVNGTNIFSW